jgi:hypothetical protein
MPISLKLGTNTITVPYCAQVHADSENHGYMDLRANPSQIAAVPEVQGWPELIGLLEAINHPGSRIRSLGCEKSYSPYESQDFPHLTTQLASYVDVAFLDIQLNGSAIHFEEIIGAYAEFAKGLAFEPFVMFDPELSSAHYKPEGVRGFCLSVWCGGFGASEQEARRAWGTVIAALTAFFGSASSALP